PIFLATLTPAGLRLTGEVADGWIPTLFSPDHLDLFRPELEAGALAVGRSLDSLEIAPYVPVLIDDDRSAARDAIRPWVALYVGGMGSRAKNFYNEVVQRYGFKEEARDIQELYLTGKKLEAIRRVPDTLVDAITIVGPHNYVRERIEAWSSAGVTLQLRQPDGERHRYQPRRADRRGGSRLFFDGVRERPRGGRPYAAGNPHLGQSPFRQDRQRLDHHPDRAEH